MWFKSPSHLLCWKCHISHNKTDVPQGKHVYLVHSLYRKSSRDLARIRVNLVYLSWVDVHTIRKGIKQIYQLPRYKVYQYIDELYLRISIITQQRTASMVYNTLINNKSGYTIFKIMEELGTLSTIPSSVIKHRSTIDKHLHNYLYFNTVICYKFLEFNIIAKEI